ncbi:hypothetical protein EV213_1289 [Aureibacillus halotolerans]|uniref:Uncharacterized protein n=1 Tax=Aureibacillus halotolerans TaxID=1508390 RepID=A0A4R6TTH7_9BACI|nr:hypothetical protein EV213_1289 [Aureibacillus halotolerans]
MQKRLLIQTKLLSGLLLVMTPFLTSCIASTEKIEEKKIIHSMVVVIEKQFDDDDFFIKAYDPYSEQEDIMRMKVENEKIYNLIALDFEYSGSYTIFTDESVRLNELKVPNLGN